MGGLLDHIGPACQQARENAGLRQIDIATELNTSNAAVSRFESGAGRSPERIDAMVTAYAHRLEVSELQIWQRAIELWQQSA